MIKAVKYSHPNWGMKLLITEEEGGRQLAIDMLGEDDDPNLLVGEAVELDEKEFENLSEWDG